MAPHLSIRLELLGAFLVVALFAVAAAFINVTEQESVARNNLAVEHAYARAAALLEMKNTASEVDTEIVGTLSSIQKGAAQAEGTPVSEKKYALLATLELLNKWKDEYKKNVDTGDSEDVAFISQIDTLENTIVDTTLHYIALREQGITGSETDQAYQTLIQSVSSLKEGIENTVSQEQKDIQVAREAAAAAKDRATVVNNIIALATILIAILLGLLLNARIVGPVRRIRDAAMRIAAGDLSQLVPSTSHDEVGDLAKAFNDMAARLVESHEGLKLQVTQTKEKATALAEQVQETEKTKLAVLNLLEDIEQEKKNAELMVVKRTQELHDEKARLLASINSLSFGFIIFDNKDKALLQNPALSTILELKKPVKTVHDLTDYFGASFDGVIEKFDPVGTCHSCMELHEIVEMKEVSYGKKYLRIICAPISEESGAKPRKDGSDVIGYVFMIEDITEAKVLQRSRDEFFAVASHELRTPLTAIRGNADMILDMFADKITDPDVKEMLVDINTSSIRLIDIVNDFLEVSRLEQGKIELKNELFPMDDVISKVVRDLKQMIEQKGLKILYTPVKGTCPQVFADKNRAEQITLNLVGNAIKFTKEGSITITVTYDSPFVKVSVIDTGTGISEQNQALLFRKFQQAGEQVLARDVTQSTGLGLYISKLIISKMGGTIGLERSELGKGSTFSFTLPTKA